MKYVLFTGAAGGLASACICRLLREDGGWTVLAADVNPEGLDRLAAQAGGRVVPLVMDVTDDGSCAAAAEQAARITDHLDAVVHTAGMHAMASLVEGDPAALMERMMQINLLGMVRVNRFFFGLLEKARGRILLFSSECGWEKPQPFNAHYAVTKHAVEAYADGLRRELNFLGMRVIKIQPGSFRTHMHQDAADSFVSLKAGTTHYQQILTHLAPLMQAAMNHPHDPGILAKTVLRALCSRHPRLRYRCRSTWYLCLMNPLPDRLMDFLYRKAAGVK